MSIDNLLEKMVNDAKWEAMVFAYFAIQHIEDPTMTFPFYKYTTIKDSTFNGNVTFIARDNHSSVIFTNNTVICTIGPSNPAVYFRGG